MRKHCAQCTRGRVGDTVDFTTFLGSRKLHHGDKVQSSKRYVQQRAAVCSHQDPMRSLHVTNPLGPGVWKNSPICCENGSTMISEHNEQKQHNIPIIESVRHTPSIIGPRHPSNINKQVTRCSSSPYSIPFVAFPFPIFLGASLLFTQE